MEETRIVYATTHKAHLKTVQQLLPGNEIFIVSDEKKLFEALKEQRVDAMLLDSAALANPAETIPQCRALKAGMPIIAVIEDGQQDGPKMVDAGTDDYLMYEELSSGLLKSALRYAMERQVLLVEMEQYARELLKNEEHFKNLIASNVDGMIVITKEHTVCYMNAAAENMLGVPADSQYGKKFEYEWKLNAPVELTFQKDEHHKVVAEMRVVKVEWEREQAYLAMLRDVTDRTKAEEERIKLIRELQGALHQVKTLNGLLPICAVCKKIRDDKGYWNQIEGYISEHSRAEFSHGICPDCQKKLYGDLEQQKG